MLIDIKFQKIEKDYSFKCFFHFTIIFFAQQSFNQNSDLKYKVSLNGFDSINDLVIPFVFNFINHPVYAGELSDINLYNHVSTSMFIDKYFNLGGIVASDAQLGIKKRNGGYIFGDKFGSQINYGTLF